MVNVCGVSFNYEIVDGRKIWTGKRGDHIIGIILKKVNEQSYYAFKIINSNTKKILNPSTQMFSQYKYTIEDVCKIALNLIA